LEIDLVGGTKKDLRRFTIEGYGKAQRRVLLRFRARRDLTIARRRYEPFQARQSVCESGGSAQAGR